MNKKKLLGAAFGVALLAGLVPAAAASAAVQPDATTVTWQLAGGPGSQIGNYLGIYGGGKANGNYANTFKWENVSNQKWYSVLKATGEYEFENVNSGKCLEDNGGKVSARIDQWTCEANHDNELWMESYVSGSYQLQNVDLWDDEGYYVDACADQNGDGYLFFANVEAGSCQWH